MPWNDAMPNDLPWDELDRYFSGQSSREDADAVTQRAASDAEYSRELALVRCVWEAGAGRREFDANAAWRRVAAHVAPPVVSRTTHAFAPLLGARRPRRGFAMFVFAASVLFAIAAGVVVHRRDAGSRAEATGTAPSRAYATRDGQRMEVLLPDGTRIDLNVASRLRVPRGYGVTTRDVELDGEAYFEVPHDSALPFRVHAGRLVAEDVGTSFVVRAYAGDSTATVAVTGGQVAMRSVRLSASAVNVRSGQVGRLESTGDIAVLHHADVSRYTSWREGRLEFRDTPLPAVARELERWYGVRIAVADTSLARATLTASFTNQPLDDVLHIVAGSLRARYTRRDTQVRLYTSESRP